MNYEKALHREINDLIAQKLSDIPGADFSFKGLDNRNMPSIHWQGWGPGFYQAKKVITFLGQMLDNENTDEVYACLGKLEKNAAEDDAAGVARELEVVFDQWAQSQRGAAQTALALGIEEPIAIGKDARNTLPLDHLTFDEDMILRLGKDFIRRCRKSIPNLVHDSNPHQSNVYSTDWYPDEGEMITTEIKQDPLAPAAFYSEEIMFEGDICWRGDQLFIPNCPVIPEATIHSASGRMIGDIIETGLPIDSRKIRKITRDGHTATIHFEIKPITLHEAGLH